MKDVLFRNKWRQQKMDSVFSALHSKRGDVTEDKIEVSKHDLKLVRTKWHEMNLSYMPKCQLLYECIPDFFLQMNSFCNMGEDSIERWYQVCMRHHAQTRSIKSFHKQKRNQAKHQLTVINAEVNNVIEDTKEKRKKQMIIATLKK